MELINEELEKLKLLSQEYAVYITDSFHSTCGSGVLYNPGFGINFYVFTCAHVIDSLEGDIHLCFLIPQNREKEQYTTYHCTVSKEVVAYSPIDVIEKNELGEIEHTVDVAVIPVLKMNDFCEYHTPFAVVDPHLRESVFIQGFPNGAMFNHKLLEILDIAQGNILHLPDANGKFQLRITDDFMDLSNRCLELQGFSGAAVWSCKGPGLNALGLIQSAMGDTAYRSRVFAIDLNIVREIMSSQFHIRMESTLLEIPVQDIAGDRKTNYCGYRKEDSRELYDLWITDKIHVIRAYIYDLKMQAAIDYGEQTILDNKFQQCDLGGRKRFCQYLLYCYQVCYQYDAYNRVERQMKSWNLLQDFEDHDPLRWLTNYFQQANYCELIRYSQKVLELYRNRPGLIQTAEVFSTLGRAYTENLTVEESIQQYLDKQERLKILVDDVDRESLFYQMFGFVYANRYHDYQRAIRCLNYAYKIAEDKVVLETLACIYYHFAIHQASDKNGKLYLTDLSTENLYKARACFLTILEKADELHLSCILKRDGGALYHTFCMMGDNHWIIKLYPLMKKYMPEQPPEFVRNVELPYARTICQCEKINFSDFSALTQDDRLMIELLEAESQVHNIMDAQMAVETQNPELESKLSNLIERAEALLPHITIDYQEELCTRLMNLYGRGIQLFNWEVMDKLEELLIQIKKFENEDLIKQMSIFLYEQSHTIKETEEMYRNAWENDKSSRTWLEWLNFYIRHRLLDQADHMFLETMEKEDKEFVNQRDFIYRSYIDFTLTFHRDPTNALKIYCTYENDMNDLDAKNFWEMELMLVTNNFNCPDRFEYDRVEELGSRGMPYEKYHRDAFIAYMCNLNSAKATEHLRELYPNGFHGIIPIELRHYLVWQRRVPPRFEEEWHGMMPDKIEDILRGFAEETWAQDREMLLAKYDFPIKKKLAVDAWAMYLLAESGILEKLDEFDDIYISHLSISRILEELTHYENIPLRMALEYIECNKKKNIHIQTADFRSQISLRQCGNYDEPGSTIAISINVNCPALLGEPELQSCWSENYANRILRLKDIN